MNTNINKLKRLYSKNNAIKLLARRQFRNENEKRRRDLSTQLITNLKDILLIENTSDTNEDNTKLDKASVLGQTVTFLKKHQQNIKNKTKLALPNLQNSSSSSSSSNSILEFSWKPPCDITSIDEWLQLAIENIHSYFGYSQDELINHSLFDFILPSNHDQLLAYLSNNHQVLQTCDISWKRAVNNDYEQCTLIGAYRTINENDKYFMSIVKINTLDRMLRMNTDYPVEEFITYLNTQGQFVYVDSKARQMLGYDPFEIIGHTYFDFVHPDDLAVIVRAYKLWKETESGKSEPYRFLTKDDQWILLQTSSQVHINTWTGKVESYICTTYIIECHSLQQLLAKRSIHIPANNSNTDLVLLPSMITTIPSILNNQTGISSSSENEITSFLFHLRNETYRKIIFEKLTEDRKIKQNETNIRQEEIQAIDDILEFINQYHIKHSNNQLTSDEMKNPNTEDITLNMFNTNNDLTLSNNPIANTTDQHCRQIDSRKDMRMDPLSSLFPTNLFSDVSTTNDTIQNVEYLTSTTNPTND
ncbi:unnamed protein product [Adineta steineri]|uniref:Uncharacterized protein n=1 Tax=Adineta steineri TaxID=433720 RepID=A0A813W275_9BILA|nr:unnamed protein product [Adineta steineri]